MKGYKMVNDVKPGGTFLLNCQWNPRGAGASICPTRSRRYIANNNIQLLHRQRDQTSRA